MIRPQSIKLKHSRQIVQKQPPLMHLTHIGIETEKSEKLTRQIAGK